MSKVGVAIEALHRAEHELRDALLDIAERHRAEHEIFHVAHDLARWSQHHLDELDRVGRAYGSAPTVDADAPAGRPDDDPLPPLLADLRYVHRVAAGVSLDWEVLAQTAQALKHRDLLALAQECHPQTLRQLRWANAKLKEAAAQAMVTA